MRKALLAAVLSLGLFGTTSAQLVDSIMYDYGVLRTDTTGFLRRDGGNTIKGIILPDLDLTYELGSEAAAFNAIFTHQLLGTTAAGTLTLYNGSAPGLKLAMTSTGAMLQMLATPNDWQAGVFDRLLAVEGITQLGELAANTGAANYAMGSTKLTGLTAGTLSGDTLAFLLNPINHLAPATAAYDMDGFGFTDWAGSTSSNAAQVDIISNKTAAAGAGLNLRWNAAAAVAAGYYPLSVQYDNATGTRDVMKMGYQSTTESVLFLPDKDGGNDAGIAEVHLVMGESNDFANTGTVALRGIPNSFSGAWWIYVGGELALDIRKSGQSINFQPGYVFQNNGLFKAQTGAFNGTDFANEGSYQFGFNAAGAPAAGTHTGWLRGLVGSSVSTTVYTNHIARLNYLGQFFSGQHGDAAVAPLDGRFRAAGWIDPSTTANQAGVDGYFGSGPGTGNSTSGGAVIFETPDAGASSTAVQALTTKATLERDGDLALKAGTSAGTIAKVGGAISYSTTQVGNAALTETDLFTYSVPANTLETNGDSLDLFAGGTLTASVSVDKRVRAYFGATTIFDSGALAITAATDWRLECQLIRSGAATQKSVCAFSTSSATLSAYADYSAPAETLSGAVTLKVTGSGTLASDVVGELWKVLWSSAP